MAPSKAKKAPAKAAAPRKRAAKKDDAVVVAQDSDADHVLALQGVNTHSIQQSKDWQSELRVVVGDVWLDRPAPGALPGETLRILQFHAGQVVNAAQLATAKDLGLTVKTRSVQESDLPGLI